MTGSSLSTMPVSRRLKISFIVLLVFGWVYWIYATQKLLISGGKNIPLQQDERDSKFASECRIPFFEVMSADAKKSYEKVSLLNCERQKPLTRVKGVTLFIDEKAVPDYNLRNDKIRCCYSYIYRKEQSRESINSLIDSQIRYGPCTTFDSPVNLTSDFVQVTCKNGSRSVYTNAHAAITPRISKKASSQKTSSEDNLQLSVMLIGVDSLSRLNFQRQMPKTYQSLQDMGFIQYFKYNKIADNTYPNLAANLAGRFPEELMNCPNKTCALDGAPWIFKNFSSKGYVTFYAEDSPDISTFTFRQFGFVDQPTDYYYRPFSQAFTNLENFNDGPCFQNQMDPLVNYTWNFMNSHQTSPFFGLSWGVQLSHNDMNGAQRADPIYYALFQKLQFSDLLNTTVLFFLSDHGLRVGAFRQTHQGRIEERLPAFFAHFPPWFERKYPQAFSNFRDNAHRLTSNFDFYQTLSSLLNVSQLADPSSLNSGALRGQSLFTHINVSRTCSDAGINDHWCTCFSRQLVPVNATVIRDAADFVVNFINGLLSQATQCSSLSLDNVLDSSLEYIQHNETKHERDQQYYLRIRTFPGKALMETTLIFNSKSKRYEIVGSVSRVNLYGNQSWCVMIRH